MATKKQKRERGEAKAKREAEERRASGLAAQKAAREYEERKRALLRSDAKEVNHRHTMDLLYSGINPETGVIFTDEEMEYMEKHATTPERRHTFERIRAGRDGALNTQPPWGGWNDYIDEPLNGMTVGDFRKLADDNWKQFQEELKKEFDGNHKGSGEDQNAE